MHFQGPRSQGLRAVLVTVALFTAVPSFCGSRSKPKAGSQSAVQLTAGPWRAGDISVLNARTDWILNLPLGDVSKSGRILLSRAPAGTIPNSPETHPLVTRQRPGASPNRSVPPATADTFTNAAGGGNWNNAGYWSAGLPNSGTDADITGTGSAASVVEDVSATINNLN